MAVGLRARARVRSSFSIRVTRVRGRQETSMHRLVRERRVRIAICLFASALACGGGSTQPAAATIQAEAGADQAVSSGALVTLNGNATTVPAGLPVTYAWSQVSGPAVTLSAATAKSPTFTAPTVASGQQPSALVFSLVASAGTATSAPSQVTITVSAARPPNADPVANAGPDQSIASASAVTLDGRGSFDPDGETLAFAWTSAPTNGVALTGA